MRKSKKCLLVFLKCLNFTFILTPGVFDGSASAILFRHAGGLKQNVHQVPAGRVEDAMRDSGPFLDPDVPIIMVDISPSLEFAKQIVVRGNLWIIDHHKSASYLNEMHPNFFVDVNNDACGSENFRRWLVKNHFIPFPEESGFNISKSLGFGQEYYVRFCKLIDDHDRWILKFPFSIEMPKFFSFVGQKDFIERFMDVQSRFSEEKESYWNSFEEDLMKLLRRIQEQRYRALFEKMQVEDRVMLGRPVRAAYIITDEVNNSEMLNLYLNENPEIDVAIQISFGLQKVALRSNNKIDVSEIAKQFGGGGHKNAAGHPIPAGMIKDIVGSIHGARSRNV